MAFIKEKRYLVVGVFILFASVNGCSDNSSSPDVDPEPDPDEFIINPDSRPLDEHNWQNYLQEIDSTDFTLTFSNSFDESEDWEDGDILISNEGNGLLREIVEIDKNNDVTTVSTQQASLTDYIDQGKIELRVPLEVEDIQEPEKIEYTLEGSRILFDSDSLRQHELYKENQNGIPWKLDSKIKKDLFKNFESEFSSGVTLSGEYLLKTDLILEMDIKIRRKPLRYFELSYEIENEFKLTFKAESKATFEGSVKLTKKPINFTPIVIPTPVGPPITIHPSLEVYVGVNGEVFGALETDASYKNALKIGSQYEPSTGWVEINERPEPESDVNPPYINLGGSAAANITPKFKLYAYNILGGYATAEVYSLVEAGINRDPWWELFLGLRAGLGVGAEIWEKELLDLSRDDMIDKRWSVAKAESNILPTVNTVSVGQITKESANVVGEVERPNGASPITGRGICWSEEENPTLDDECKEKGEDVGEFSVNISNLNENTGYYAVAYGTNKAGTQYGDAINFSTNEEANVPPSIEITGGPSDGETIDYQNPQFEWNGSDEDGNVEEYSVELNGPASEDFTTTGNNYQFEGLTNGDYTFRVRAVDNEGAQSAWASREFTVAVETENQPPIVEITAGPNDGETINYSNPQFEWRGSDEDGSIDEYNVELNGPDSEEFTTNNTDHQFQDLSYSDYEFRVRAIDNEGSKSAWASREFTVQRSATRPTVTTLEVSSITATSAQSGGDVTDNGGDEVSVRGVCWSTSENPDAEDDCTNDGGGEGEFTSLIEDLSPDTKYYVRAYAVNIEGISYGDQRGFLTKKDEKEEFAGGDGTKENPYQISTINHLQNISDYLDRHFIQINNIDASVTSEWNGGQGFQPIGDREDPFSGIYEGNGFEITGLTIYREDKEDVGLFGFAENAQINNTELINLNIFGKSFVGGLVGIIREGQINNVYATGEVSSSRSGAGGLVAISTEGSNIRSSYSKCEVSGERDVGGLVGQNDYSQISSSFSTGNVSGGSWIGGLVGVNLGQINDSYAMGDVHATGDDSKDEVGGLVGYNLDGAVTTSFAIGKVTSDINVSVGGLVGWNADISTIEKSYWDKETSRQNDGFGGGTGTISGAVGLNTSQMTGSSAKENMPEFNWSNIWKTTSDYPILRWQD